FLDDSAHHHLVDSCDAAVSVITINRNDYELLSARYSIDHSKLEYMTVNLQNDPADKQINWFHLGRQYWRVLEKQLGRIEGELRSLQASREHSVLYSQ
ncbi:MAG: hypothetical protein JW795_04610, partial [Chitinivibrionales bacterium]|nr:hypothetical protein [Chitinivibrionales bacterium]